MRQSHINSHSESNDEQGWLVENPVEIRVERRSIYNQQRRTQLAINHRPSNNRGILLRPNGTALSQRDILALRKERITNVKSCSIVIHHNHLVLDLEFDD